MKDLFRLGQAQVAAQLLQQALAESGEIKDVKEKNLRSLMAPAVLAAGMLFTVGAAQAQMTPQEQQQVTQTARQAGQQVGQQVGQASGVGGYAGQAAGQAAEVVARTATGQKIDGSVVGGAIGAAVGGAAGYTLGAPKNRTLGTVLGVGIGAVGGSILGRAISPPPGPSEEEKMRKAMPQAAPATGQPQAPAKPGYNVNGGGQASMPVNSNGGNSGYTVGGNGGNIGVDAEGRQVYTGDLSGGRDSGISRSANASMNGSAPANGNVIMYSAREVGFQGLMEQSLRSQNIGIVRPGATSLDSDPVNSKRLEMATGSLGVASKVYRTAFESWEEVQTIPGGAGVDARAKSATDLAKAKADFATRASDWARVRNVLAQRGFDVRGADRTAAEVTAGLLEPTQYTATYRTASSPSYKP